MNYSTWVWNEECLYWQNNKSSKRNVSTWLICLCRWEMWTFVRTWQEPLAGLDGVVAHTVVSGGENKRLFIAEAQIVPHAGPQAKDEMRLCHYIRHHEQNSSVLQVFSTLKRYSGDSVATQPTRESREKHRDILLPVRSEFSALLHP